MRFRATHLTCLLLLLSSLAVSAAHASNVAPTRTPGGVFVRNLLLQAAVEEAEPARSDFSDEDAYVVAVCAPRLWSAALPVPAPVAHTAHVHAVTGSSL